MACHSRCSSLIQILIFSFSPFPPQVSLVLGRVENTERFLSVALYQGVPRISSQYALARATAAGQAAPIMSQQSSEGGDTSSSAAAAAAAAAGVLADPTIIAAAFKRNRFFLFTRREPAEMMTEVRCVYFVMLFQCFYFR